MNRFVNSKAELIDLLAKNRATILSFGVSKMGLFGSFVRNESTANSDVDFIVEFASGKKNYDNYIELAFYLEELLGRKIELLTTESLSPYIGAKILNEVEYVVAA